MERVKGIDPSFQAMGTSYLNRPAETGARASRNMREGQRCQEAIPTQTKLEHLSESPHKISLPLTPDAAY